jgi:heme-degrading monooxygenase HmoA
LITEHALLNVLPDQTHDFETAVKQAVPLISASDGFLGIEVLPCLEQPNLYLLLVKWTSVEAHEVGFRGSDRYQKWKSLLHHYYQPFPVVSHFGQSILR